MRRGVGVGALKQAQEKNSKIAVQAAKLDEASWTRGVLGSCVLTFWRRTTPST